MKRLLAMLAAGLAVLALSACGKQETKPQDGAMTDKTATTEQSAQPAAEEPKPADDAQKPSAQADQYNGVAQARADDAAAAAAADQDQDQSNQS